MDTTSFISTLTQAKQGNTQAQELLIHKFLPLIRKYAYKCHAMEFENAQQELIFALLAAVHSITYIQNEGECIRYLQKGILNYFKYLCRTSLYATRNMNRYQQMITLLCFHLIAISAL